MSLTYKWIIRWMRAKCKCRWYMYRRSEALEDRKIGIISVVNIVNWSSHFAILVISYDKPMLKELLIKSGWDRMRSFAVGVINIDTQSSAVFL